MLQRNRNNSIEGDLGKQLILYSDVNKLEKHLIELSPADSLLIKEFTDAVRKCAWMMERNFKFTVNKKIVNMRRI